MGICPNCNSEIAHDSITCPGCGVVLQPAALALNRPAAVSLHPSASRSRRFRVSTPTVVAVILTAVVGCFVYAGVQQAREGSRQVTTSCRLKLLGLAAHNFSDKYGHFPPRNLPTIGKAASVTISPDEVPQSFFADVLPYMDQAALYQQIDPKLPWTNPAQQAVFSTVIANYQHPSVPHPPRNDDGYALAHFATNSRCICDTKTVKQSEITDGTSNTMLLGTVNDGFQAWGDPTNYRDPGKGFGGGPEAFGAPNRRATLQILLFDGSVRSVRTDLPLDLCHRIGEPANGDSICDEF